MSANTSSRKSFTQRDYVCSSTDGVRIDLYSQQDTRMYHYPYAWEAFTLTYVRARTHTRMYILELEGEFTYQVHARECPAWAGIDLAYPIDTSSFSLSLSLPRSSPTLSFSGHSQFYERFQDPWRCNLTANNVRSPHPPVISFFFPGLRESWIMRQAWDCHAKPVAREEKQAPRTERYFHPNARQSATLVYVLG